MVLNSLQKITTKESVCSVRVWRGRGSACAERAIKETDELSTEGKGERKHKVKGIG